MEIGEEQCDPASGWTPNGPIGPSLNDSSSETLSPRIHCFLDMHKRFPGGLAALKEAKAFAMMLSNPGSSQGLLFVLVR